MYNIPDDDIYKILIVEDSRLFRKVLRAKLNEQDGVEIFEASNMKEAIEICKEITPSITLLDMVLPDAPDGEIIEYMTDKDIPSIVFTSIFKPELREQILSLGVVDYVVKSGPSSVDYIGRLVERLKLNRNITALVVDDSRSSRKIFANMLESCCLNIMEAENAEEALDILAKEESIGIVTLDYEMGKVNGIELLKKIRYNHSRDDLPIIGVSGSATPLIVAEFLKHGANDFISKRCTREEFIVRMMQNMELCEVVNTLKRQSLQDHLTGLYNRRFLNEVVTPQYEGLMRAKTPCAVSVMDLDHFKSINDNYGHDAGDFVLKEFASIVLKSIRKSDIALRIGGEEFAVVMPNMGSDNSLGFFDSLRKRIEEHDFVYEKQVLPVTVSIGITNFAEENLNNAMKLADSMLYKAKESGRNQVSAAENSVAA